MATRAARFTQIDLKRAVKGVSDGGMRVGRVEIDPNGKLVIMADTMTPALTSGSWDEVLK